MKKVLFATTALVATTGFAAADVSLSGSAGAGLYYNAYEAETEVYSEATLDVSMSGQTDNGLTFGATMDVTAGYTLDLGDVDDEDWDNDYGDADGNFSFGSIFISGDFGTLTFDHEGIENAYNDDYDHDISYEYGVGGFALFLSYGVDATAGNGNVWSLDLSYDMDQFSAFLETDDSNELHLGVAYDVTPELNVGVNHKTDGSITEFTASYDSGVISVDAAADNNSGWDLGFGYSADGLSVDLSTDEVSEWVATGAYDLGGGLEIVAGTAYTGNWYIGAAMSF